MSESTSNDTSYHSTSQSTIDRDVESVALLDILVTLANKKVLITKIVGAFFVLGVAYALLATEDFTSTTQVMRETESEIPRLGGGLAALGSSFGISVGNMSGGLNSDTYIDIISSREVRLAVARDTFQFPDESRPMTLVEYLAREPGLGGTILNYTVYLPWTLKSAMMGEEIGGVQSTPSRLTEDEYRAVRSLKYIMSTSTDPESGLLTIDVTTESPTLSYEVARSFLDHLTTRVREIRTEKVRERLDFVETRFAEVQGELRAAEENLAAFLERNQNPTVARLQFEEDRLRRNVSFKEQLYSEFQKQLTQARIELQRQSPVVTVVEKPMIPNRRSFPSRTLIVIFSILAGGLVAVGFVLGRDLLRARYNGPEEMQKIASLKSAISLRSSKRVDA